MHANAGGVDCRADLEFVDRRSRSPRSPAPDSSVSTVLGRLLPLPLDAAAFKAEAVNALRNRASASCCPAANCTLRAPPAPPAPPSSAPSSVFSAATATLTIPASTGSSCKTRAKKPTIAPAPVPSGANSMAIIKSDGDENVPAAGVVVGVVVMVLVMVLVAEDVGVEEAEVVWVVVVGVVLCVDVPVVDVGVVVVAVVVCVVVVVAVVVGEVDVVGVVVSVVRATHSANAPPVTKS